MPPMRQQQVQGLSESATMGTKKTLVGQLRGATRLAVDATRHVTDLVETMHHTIGAGPALLGRPLESAMKLLTAPTYGAIRGVTNVVDTSLDLALSALPPMLDQAGAEGGTLLAALNGVVGDYLVATDNPLAIEMQLCHDGKALELARQSLELAFPEGDRLLVLLHGSSMDERGWRRKGHDHGSALASDAELMPIYLRYNSGLHISQNGRDFAALMEKLVAAFPRPITEITFLGHSMGGLVARSACAIAEADGHAWRQKLRALATLGTPHHGAPLERGGNWLGVSLGVSRYSAPLTGLAKLRSAGVTDLRYGNVLDADWQGQDRFAPNGDTRTALPLPVAVNCFAVAATTATASVARPPGDGLVPVDSALGKHPNPARVLDFGESHQWLVQDATHLDLLNSGEVYAKLLAWLAPEANGPMRAAAPTQRFSQPGKVLERD